MIDVTLFIYIFCVLAYKNAYLINQKGVNQSQYWNIKDQDMPAFPQFSKFNKYVFSLMKTSGFSFSEPSRNRKLNSTARLFMSFFSTWKKIVDFITMALVGKYILSIDS